MSSSSSSRPGQPQRASTSTVQPPPWQAPYHKTADLGYPDFHPPRPGQEEDSMAEAYVKNGYTAKGIVQTDNFTVHEMIHDTWEKADQAVLRQLGDLMSEVASRRERAAPAIGSSTFKLPDRRTFTGPKSQAWFNDLANPDVPLNKLNKIIPHGPKGSDLLDMLESNRVPTQRAVWYVRVAGAADIQNMSRARTSFNPSQYSIDLATTVTSYLRKHLDLLVLPRAQTVGGTAIRSTFRSLLSEPESRDKWIHKFSYTLGLLREFYDESLVDHGTVLFWLSLQVGLSNIIQLGFIIKVVQEYHEALLQHRGFLRLFIVGLMEKLIEITHIPQPDRAVVLQLGRTLGSLLQQTFVALPDAFIYPRLWKDKTNHFVLYNLLVKGPQEIVQVPYENPQARPIYDQMRELFESVDKRNRALLFHNLPARNSFAMRVAMEDIQLLNSIGPETDLHSITYFDNSTPATDQSSSPSTPTMAAPPSTPSPPPSSFETKLNILLTWSVAKSQYGDHRPYAAATLVSLWKDEAKLRAIRRKAPKPDAALQEQLFNWLSSSDIAKDHRSNATGLALLFGELMRRNLFSYGWFIRRLMARGEISANGAKDSHLTAILATLPVPTPDFAAERRVALYGVAEAAKSKDVLDKSVRKQIKAALPTIFGGDDAPQSATNFSALLSASCFDQHFAVIHWLYPAVLDWMLRDCSRSMDTRTYATLVEIMRLSRCYSSILDLSLRLLRSSDINDVQAIVDTFTRHADVWASMDALSTIGETLFATHNRLKSSQQDSRMILEALSRPEYSKHLSPQTKQQVEVDSTALSQGIQITGPALGAVQPIIQEILDLKGAPSLDEASSLAHRLWEQFKHHSGVCQVIWDNAIQGVCQVEALSPDHSLRMEYVRLYSRFIQTFSQLVPLNSTLDSAINHWFRHEDGRREFSEFDANTWMTISLFILEMVLQGCLTTSTILSNVAYVAWKKAADLEAPSEQAETFLRAANLLTERLLLQDMPSQQNGMPSDSIPPLDLIQVQRYQTQRQKIYTGSGVKSVFGAMRNLVWLELNPNLSQDVREESTRIRMALCQHHQFRTTAFRHLQDLKQLFVRSLSSEKDVRLADALRLIVHVDDVPDGHSGTASEPSSEWRAVFAQLNAWGFSRASIELRLTLESMGSGLELTSGPIKAKAEQEIKGFMSGLFCRDLHPEETDLTAQVLDRLSGPLATQFVNYGVNRLAELLENLEAQPLSITSASRFLDVSGEVLRLLGSVAIPAPNTEWTPATFEGAVVERFMRALLKALTTADKIASLKDPALATASMLAPDFYAHPKLSELIILLARMTQFVMRFDGVWTAKVKGLSEELIACFVYLAVSYGGGTTTDPTLFRLLTDTASYVMDEAPKDAKMPNIDLVRQVKGVHPDRLPSGMPHEFRTVLRPLLNYIPTDRYTQDLVYLLSSTDIASGKPAHGVDPEAQYQLGPAVPSRAWEWTEYIEEPPTDTASEGRGERSMEVKNDTSVPLEHFMARATGEPLSSHRSSRDDSDVIGNPSRHAEDRLHRESIYERDWKDSRIGNGASFDDPESSESEADDPSPLSRIRGVTDDSRSNSVMSPGGSTISRRTGTTEREIIDVDALDGPQEGPSRGTKRKATASSSGVGRGSGVGSADLGDDDIEIIEPEPMSSTAGKTVAGKRGRGRPTGSVARGRGKKKP